MQYEVKQEQPLTCGGAYIKLLDATTEGIENGEFDNEVRGWASGWLGSTWD